MLSKYKVVLFDSDNTLYNHDIHERTAIFEVLKACGIPTLDEYHILFRDINSVVWQEFERGVKHKNGHVVERFSRFLSAAGIDFCPFKMNELYIEALSNQCSPFPESQEVLSVLSKTHKLYIITNGTESIQVRRFNASPLRPNFSGIFTADGVGIQKPYAEFFERVLKDIGSPKHEEVIVIGDSLTSDILGGVNAGLDTCWYNPNHNENTLGVDPTYEIEKLTELIS